MIATHVYWCAWFCDGVIAGLVAITPGAGHVELELGSHCSIPTCLGVKVVYVVLFVSLCIPLVRAIPAFL